MWINQFLINAGLAWSDCSSLNERPHESNLQQQRVSQVGLLERFEYGMGLAGLVTAHEIETELEPG